MLERLKIIKNKYDELTIKLTSQEVLNDFNLLKKISKEHSDLEKTVIKYNEYLKNESEIDTLKEILNDNELGEIAKIELENLVIQQEKTIQELEVMLLPQDPNDEKNVIMEIRGAAGGDEANIFAGDLFRMYSKYAEKKGWHIDVTHYVEGTSGGYAQVELIISGEKVYSFLKFESGSHRVQRIPETETQGRVHTSTATIVVMPEAEEVEIEVKESDLKIDVYHSSGAGGQSVNTSNSAVRITHMPTGVVVTCQNERSQMKNKEKAMHILKARLYDELQERQAKELGQERKIKVGTGDRSEKIRTYNYPQNRVTDHRINFSVMELDKVMDGYLDEIIDALVTEDQRIKLANE